jgi:hypothetical protein
MKFQHQSVPLSKIENFVPDQLLGFAMDMDKYIETTVQIRVDLSGSNNKHPISTILFHQLYSPSTLHVDVLARVFELVDIILKGYNHVSKHNNNFMEAQTNVLKGHIDQLNVQTNVLDGQNHVLES